jgi:hypothetical protein
LADSDHDNPNQRVQFSWQVLQRVRGLALVAPNSTPDPSARDPAPGRRVNL